YADAISLVETGGSADAGAGGSGGTGGSGGGTSGRHIYWGATPGATSTGALCDRTKLACLTSLESDVGKGAAIWHWPQYWVQLSWNDPSFHADWLDTARNHGTIPMVTWNCGNAGGANQPACSLSTIIGGQYDSYITQWAQAAKAWGHPFFIRLFHEFN